MMPSRRVFLIAGESSGDLLGAHLMRACRAIIGDDIQFVGVGGPRMCEEGLESLFPLSDISVMGFLPVIKNLPRLLRRIHQTTQAVIKEQPDILVLIDSPDFTHRVARKVREVAPNIPIIDYVSPSVWAWRPGRARKMRAYIDHVLALLPFEPMVYERLNGPQCTYVGHPLLENPVFAAPPARNADHSLVLLMPGSRLQEIDRLLDDFYQTIKLLQVRVEKPLHFVMPTVPHLFDIILRRVQAWSIPVHVVLEEEKKIAAFQNAQVALVASGTATLELALAQVPMVVAYKVSAIESLARYLIKVKSIVLPNLILGENVIPEYIQENCAPEKLAEALAPLLREGEAREKQISAFEHLRKMMELPDGVKPSEKAAQEVLNQLSNHPTRSESTP